MTYRAFSDTLNGGAGNDTMNGGTGADTFKFDAGLFGADKILQFANGTDKIQVTGIAGVTSFANLVVTAVVGGGALVTFPDGSTINLAGMTVGQVDASDFIFGP